VITQVSQAHGLNLGLLISGMLQRTQIGKLWYRNGSGLKLQARPKEYVSLLYSFLFIFTIKFIVYKRLPTTSRPEEIHWWIKRKKPVGIQPQID
jgi:hypothetical protein